MDNGSLLHGIVRAGLDNSSMSICDAYQPQDLNSSYLNEETRVALDALYVILSLIFAISSIIGCVLIIYFYYSIPQLKTSPRKLLVYLSLCDVMVAIGNTIGVIWGHVERLDIANGTSLSPSSVITCETQAIISSSFSIASFMWTGFIALNIFLTVVYNNKALVDRLWLVPHVVSWSIPIVVFAVSIAEQRYGYNPCDKMWWCWIQPKVYDKQPWDVIKWQLWSGKGWEMFMYVTVCILYGAVKQYIYKVGPRSRAPSTESSHLLGKDSEFHIANRKLTFVPLVFIIARIWGTLRFLLDEGNPLAKAVADCLAPLQGAGDSAQGFLNCVVFIATTPCIKERVSQTLGSSQKYSCNKESRKDSADDGYMSSCASDFLSTGGKTDAIPVRYSTQNAHEILSALSV